MERRNFLRSILGVAAATALPSEVWPFRKIFLPARPSTVSVLSSELNNALELFKRNLDKTLLEDGTGELWVMNEDQSKAWTELGASRPRELLPVGFFQPIEITYLSPMNVKTLPSMNRLNRKAQW